MTRRANGEGSVYWAKDGRWVGATYADTNTGGRSGSSSTAAPVEAKGKPHCFPARELDAGVRVSAENWNVEAYLAHWLETVVKPA